MAKLKLETLKKEEEEISKNGYNAYAYGMYKKWKSNSMETGLEMNEETRNYLFYLLDKYKYLDTKEK